MPTIRCVGRIKCTKVSKHDDLNVGGVKCRRCMRASRHVDLRHRHRNVEHRTHEGVRAYQLEQPVLGVSNVGEVQGLEGMSI